MAKYQDPNAVTKVVDLMFNGKHKPGTTVPHSGIYKCTGCGHEAACNKGDPFPPQNKHQHSGTGLLSSMLPVEWQMVVATNAP